MKILIVDDELVSRTKLMQIMGEFGECVLSESGNEALIEFNHAWDIGAPFDLISLDINMADMSGIDVLKIIRNLETKKGLVREKLSKVIMVTAYADQEFVVGSVKAGCNNYIVKPFNRDRVVEKLKTIGFNGVTSAKG